MFEPMYPEVPRFLLTWRCCLGGLCNFTFLRYADRRRKAGRSLASITLEAQNAFQCYGQYDRLEFNKLGETVGCYLDVGKWCCCLLLAFRRFGAAFQGTKPAVCTPCAALPNVRDFCRRHQDTNLPRPATRGARARLPFLRRRQHSQDATLRPNCSRPASGILGCDFRIWPFLALTSGSNTRATPSPKSTQSGRLADSGLRPTRRVLAN